MDEKYDLKIEPSEFLVFRFIPNERLSSFIGLQNVSDNLITFKIKTTVPSSYFVNPSQGVLLPGEKKEVSIVMRNQYAQIIQIKDKFLVQHTIAENLASSIEEVSNFWKNRADNGKIYSTKLTVKILETFYDPKIMPASPPSMKKSYIEENKSTTIKIETPTPEKTYFLIAMLMIFILYYFFFFRL